MLYHILDDRILHIGRIGHRDALIALTGLQTDGVIVEDREADLPFSTDDLNTVLTCTLMGYITPRAAARQTVLEAET